MPLFSPSSFYIILYNLESSKCSQIVGQKGGTLRLDDFGIQLEIPAGALGKAETRFIEISVLKDEARPQGAQDDEVFPGFGVRCRPSDVKFKTPVTLTIPHCASLGRCEKVQAILYSKEEESEKRKSSFG